MNGGLPPLYRRMSPVPGGGLMTATTGGAGNVLLTGQPGRPPSAQRGTSPVARGQQPLIINNSLEVQQQVCMQVFDNINATATKIDNTDKKALDFSNSESLLHAKSFLMSSLFIFFKRLY